MNNLFIIRKKYFSFIYEKKSFKILILLALISIVSILIYLSIGETNFSIPIVIKSVFGINSGYENLIVKEFRMPRAITAFLVGSCLALSGAIIQSIVKNPLASPDLIGIVNGGSVGALIFLSLFMNPTNNSLKVSMNYMPIFAFAGSFAACIFVYIFSFKNGITPYRLILVGLGVSSVGKALTSILMINGPLIFTTEANIWITGTVYGTNWSDVKILLIGFIILFVLSIILIRSINIQNLDENVAISLGNGLQINRFILLLLSTALSSLAVSIGGGISFVGLIAPHICKKIINSSFENVVPICVIVGGLIVLISDLIARTIFFPLDIPVGVFTAIIGSLFFIYLLLSEKT